MCCFSGSPGVVSRVGNTRIFARLAVPQQKQYLVYQMVFAAKEPVAMILPLPVRLPASEKSCVFHDLKGTSDFFGRLNGLFPRLKAGGHTGGAGGGFGAGSIGASRPLPVFDVGDFVASFAPTMEDFGRLDPRFVIPRATWQKIPVYEDYGFAVFQLKTKPGKSTQPHAMALEFDTRLNSSLFFPTVHIHDGRVHSSERFDHTLFMQIPDNPPTSHLASKLPGLTFVASESKAQHVLSNVSEEAQRIVDPTNFVFKCDVKGRLPNRDIILPLT